MQNPVLRKAILLLADGFLVTVAFLGALLLRFEGNIPPSYADTFPSILLALLAVRLVSFELFGLYRWSFNYASIHDFVSVVKAVACSSAVFFVIMQVTMPNYSKAVRLMEMVLSLLLVAAFRYSQRILGHNSKPTTAQAKKVLIYGAGDLGEMLVREMRKKPEMGYLPVGFIEDDPLKHSIRVHNLEVLGSKESLPSVLKETGAEEIIIAAPSMSGRDMRELLALCADNKVRIKKVAPINELLDCNPDLRRLREIAIDDLLGRQPVRLDLKGICSYLQGKVVLVTGAAGSIGSELCRQILKYGVRKLVLLDHNENKGYLLLLELRSSHSCRGANAVIVLEIADIRDRARIRQVFREHEPDVIFHAAAHKHVPLMEQNPEEAVKNNIIGTEIVAKAAHDFHAERFIMVSTDKAVNPVSAMGITKRIAEYTISDLAQESPTKFNSVRFGNVLGSDGSVIPIFKEQIARGGPVTVTHPEARRYFMTISEAAQLLIQAGALGAGGDIFILNMGEPVKVLDLAYNLITLSGLVPGRDIEITFTGLRPGEKLYEELITAEEGTTKTMHENVLRVTTNGRIPPAFRDKLHKLKAAAEANDKAQVQLLLKEFASLIQQMSDAKSRLPAAASTRMESVAATPLGTSSPAAQVTITR